MIVGGKHKGSTSAGGEQSWRSLNGGRKNTPIKSPQARKRRQTQLLKLALGLCIIFVLIGTLAWALLALKQREEPIQISTPSKPVGKIIFGTDGVLPDRWLGSVIELRKGMTLMEIDIHAMKQDLESSGQVESASVEREFPDALKISVKERIPALRMRVTGANGQVEDRIVARDGTLYKGVGYPKATLSKLPFVVPYQYPEGGIKPMRGIETVAQLLDATRRTQPNFYKTWQIVNLKHYTGDPELPGQIIEVKTSMVPRIIFGTNIDFAQQLDRLGVIMNYVQNRGNPAVRRIDLSLQGSAAVQFESGRISTF
jgi:hypothetical protein